MKLTYGIIYNTFSFIGIHHIKDATTSITYQQNSIAVNSALTEREQA